MDDGCPDGTGDLVLTRWRHLPGRLLRLEENNGQHAAVQAGMRHTRGELVVVMDADLQDSPEDVPSPARRSTPARPTWCVRAAAATTRPPVRNAPPGPTVASRGCCPVAGSPSTPECSARGTARRSSASSSSNDHAAPLVPAAALARLRIATLPVDRHTRPRGRSATGSWRRAADRRARPRDADPAAPGGPAHPTRTPTPGRRRGRRARSRSRAVRRGHRAGPAKRRSLTVSRDIEISRATTRSRSPTSPGGTCPAWIPCAGPTRRTRSATWTRSWPRRTSSRATGSSTWGAGPGSTRSVWPPAASRSPAWTSPRDSSSSCATSHLT